MIDLSKYGTAKEVAEKLGDPDWRKTLWKAMDRRDERLDVAETVGGTLLVSVKSARNYKRKPPKRGPKPKDSI